MSLFSLTKTILSVIWMNKTLLLWILLVVVKNNIVHTNVKFSNSKLYLAEKTVNLNLYVPLNNIIYLKKMPHF